RLRLLRRGGRIDVNLERDSPLTTRIRAKKPLRPFVFFLFASVRVIRGQNLLALIFVSICVHSWLVECWGTRRLGSQRPLVMNEPDHENQHAPLSYHGAWRIVWLVSLLVIVWLILRALQPVILLFAL